MCKLIRKLDGCQVSPKELPEPSIIAVEATWKWIDKLLLGKLEE